MRCFLEAFIPCVNSMLKFTKNIKFKQCIIVMQVVPTDEGGWVAVAVEEGMFCHCVLKCT